MKLQSQNVIIINPIEAIDEKIERVYFSPALDIRGIVVSPDGKYLISCSEIPEAQQGNVLIWDEATGTQRTLITKDATPEPTEVKSANNWLLCIDSKIVSTNAGDVWVISAGTKNGDVYIWAGWIHEFSGEWNLDDIFYKCISKGIDAAHTASILTIKIFGVTTQTNSFHIFTGSKDTMVKNWNIFLKIDNSNINISATVNTLEWDGKLKHSDWVLCLDLSPDEDLLCTGGRDQRVILWDLKNNSNRDIGVHYSPITNVKFYRNKVIAVSLDPIIRIWDIKNQQEDQEKFFPLIGHEDDVIAIDLMNYGSYLISNSLDNTIRIWDLVNGACIRVINISRSDLVEFFENNQNRLSSDIREKFLQENRVIGEAFLRKITISPDDRYLYTCIGTNILKIRNHGSVWHFCKQLNFIQTEFVQLYLNIYGENLKEKAIQIPENPAVLHQLYNVIRARLKHSNQKLVTYTPEYDLRVLGALFVPPFIRFAENEKFQREYVSSVKNYRLSYWNSQKDLFHEMPKFPWGFDLYLTCPHGSEENWLYYRFTDVSEKTIPVLLKSRHQTALQFLIILNGMPSSFVPLLEGIILSIEDEKGNTIDLKFTDFVHSQIDIKTNDGKLIKKNSFNSRSTFKLDDAFSLEDFAHLSIKKTHLEYAEFLNPMMTGSKDEEENEIFEAFRNSFRLAVFPKIRIKIGKGFFNWSSKRTESFIAKLVLLGLFGTLIDLLNALDFKFTDPLGIILFSIGTTGLLSILIAFILMIKGK